METKLFAYSLLCDDVVGSTLQMWAQIYQKEIHFKQQKVKWETNKAYALMENTLMRPSQMH